MGVHSHTAECEFTHIHPTQKQQPTTPQDGDHVTVLLCRCGFMGQRPGTGKGYLAAHVEQVLERDRHAGQRGNTNAGLPQMDSTFILPKMMAFWGIATWFRKRAYE